jgi:hypothetical protein
MMLSPARLLALSNRVYCLLLYLYPVPFRQEYGYHMAQVFRDDVRGTLQESGRLAVMGLWFLAFFDLLKTAVAEHVWEIFHMPIEQLTRWSGPAGAMGGLLYAVGVASIVNGVTFIIISALVTAPLLGLGLFGLYKCLPTNSTSRLTFSAALIGLLMSHMSAATIIWLDTSENLWIMLIFVGLAGMGIMAKTNQSLGRWSFTPLLVLVATMSLFSLYANDTFSLLWVILLTAYALSWILLGVALWQSHQEPQEPGMFA